MSCLRDRIIGKRIQRLGAMTLLEANQEASNCREEETDISIMSDEQFNRLMADHAQWLIYQQECADEYRSVYE